MTNELPFKVKCIYIDNDCLTVGKEYDVVEVDDGFYKVKNDSGEFWWYYNNRFEVIETPPKDKQEFSIGDKVVVNKISDGYVSHADKNVKVGDTATVTIIANFAYELCLSNPNWERGWWFSKDDVSLVADNVNTTFKVGDNVYKFGETDVKTILEVFENGYMNISNYPHRVNHESICHATQENYEMLCKPYPHIEFELPPKEITGSDLTKGMFERGDFAVVCKCSNIGEISAIASSPLRLITEYSKGRFLDNTGHLWEYAVPCDPKTNLPLTEDVLNETI